MIDELRRLLHPIPVVPVGTVIVSMELDDVEFFLYLYKFDVAYMDDKSVFWQRKNQQVCLIPVWDWELFLDAYEREKGDIEIVLEIMKLIKQRKGKKTNMKKEIRKWILLKSKQSTVQNWQRVVPP